MGEAKFLLQAHGGRSQPPQDLTPCPYSAVSSFNYPSYCDSTLITPITMPQPPSMNTKTALAIRTDKENKLSPSMMSPTYQFSAVDNDYSSGRYNHTPPMKNESPAGTLHLSTLDRSFPPSPYACPPEPYFGTYGVSATSLSGQSESSSPGLSRSPAQLHSAGDLSNSSSSQSCHSTPSQTSTNPIHNQAPRLIAPIPSGLRPATKQRIGPYRQNSLQSISTAPNSATVPQAPFAESHGSLPVKEGRKRKLPCRDERGMVFADEMPANEELLIQLHKQGTPWKDIQRRNKEEFGLDERVETLQMRKKRSIDKHRLWTDVDVRAFTLAVEEYEKNRWEIIADNMLKHGCVAKWPKEACEKKWLAMHPDDGSCSPPQFHGLPRCRPSDDNDWGPNGRAYSDGTAGVSHSLQGGAISTAPVREVRSRTASNASSQSQMLQMRRQQRQQMMTFDQQYIGWAAQG